MEASKSLGEIQKEVDALVKDIGGYWRPFQLLTAIVEELGELAKELQLKHGLRPRKEETALHTEIGDLLFTLICFANFHEISLEQAILKTIEKYRERDKEKWLQKLKEDYEET